MSDKITEVTEKSWGSRIMDSIKGVAIGALLFIASFPVLWMNEGCAVKTARGLEEGAGNVISVSADTVETANNGKLVHMSGEAKTDEVLKDAIFNLSANAIMLERTVEMYQWEENVETKTEKQTGGKEVETKTYTYNKVWSEKAINSGNFKETTGHYNPGAMPYESNEMYARNVNIGAFKLTEAQIKMIGGSEALNLTDKELQEMPADIKGKGQISNNILYIGKNPGSPEIGDVKVSFKIIKPQMISLVAQQNGSTFQSYRTEEDTDILLLENGQLDAARMFQNAQDANTMRTWLIRLLGFVLMFSGLMAIFKPLVVVADVLPFLGNLLQLGLGLFCGIIAAILSLLTIAIAWIFYRPLLAIAIIVVIVGIIAFAIFMIKKRKPATA